MFQAPDHTFSAYVAVNTNTREEVEIDLSVDDWSLALAGPDAAATPARLVADAATATLGGRNNARTHRATPLASPRFPGVRPLDTSVPREGELPVGAWQGPGGAPDREYDRLTQARGMRSGTGSGWERPLRLPAGECVITARLVGKDARLSRIVVTDEALAAR